MPGRRYGEPPLRRGEPVGRLREGAGVHPLVHAVRADTRCHRTGLARHRRADLQAEHIDGEGDGPDGHGAGRAGAGPPGAPIIEDYVALGLKTDSMDELRLAKRFLQQSGR